MYLTDEEQDRIEFMEEFPKAPRDDLIARYFYHSKISNGFDCLLWYDKYGREETIFISFKVI